MGQVYVLTNPYLPGFVKLGCSRISAESRAKSINSATGIPPKFVVSFEKDTDEPFVLESKVKQRLREFRLGRTELYNLPLLYVIKIIEEEFNNSFIAESSAPKGAKTPLTISRIGEIVNRKRKELGLTQEELAAICGCGKRIIGEIERGKQTFQFDKLVEILDKLNLQIGVYENGL